MPRTSTFYDIYLGKKECYRGKKASIKSCKILILFFKKTEGQILHQARLIYLALAALKGQHSNCEKGNGLSL